MNTMNVPSTNLLPNVHEFQMFQTIAKNAQASGLYKGVGEESKIFMILLAARELGVSPMLALNGGIWNIQGKIEISARLMNSLIRRAGHSLEIKECNNKVCILKGKRADNGDTAEASFTIEEAQLAGLSNRDVWKKYTQDMLYARAMSRLARRLFSDVIGTAYVEGEIRDTIEKPEYLQQVECEEINSDATKCDQIIDEEPIKYINKSQLKMFNERYEQISNPSSEYYDENTHKMIDESVKTLKIDGFPSLEKMKEKDWIRFMKAFDKFFNKKKKENEDNKSKSENERMVTVA
jgi:hypothetical protein